MHQCWGPHDLASVCLGDRLIAQANSEYRHFSCKISYGLHNDAGVGGHSGPGRYHQARGLQFPNALDGDLIVAIHNRFGTQLTQVLNQVIGKRIIVVDDQKHSSSRCTLPETEDYISTGRNLEAPASKYRG